VPKGVAKGAGEPLTSSQWTRPRQECFANTLLVIAQEDIHRTFSVFSQGRFSGTD
jgi:hypothetical protein